MKAINIVLSKPHHELIKGRIHKHHAQVQRCHSI
ncbi:hypothetical protein [Clostridium estertheticum]|nr:hypothetical protein [Clostridium estertheticum]